MTTQNQSPSQTFNPRSRAPTRSTVFVFCAVAIVLAFAFLRSRALWHLPNAFALLATIFFVYRIARRLAPNMPLRGYVIYRIERSG